MVESIEVTTYTSDLAYKIDQRTSGLETSPALEEGSIQGMTFEKTPGKVGESTSFGFGMTTLNTIPVGGYIQISFEDDSLQTPEPLSDLTC